MPFPLTIEEVLHFIPLAIGYAIILVLFLRSRREVKRFHEGAEAAGTVPNHDMGGQGTSPTERRMEAASLAAAAAAAAERSQYLAARAEMLRTYRRAESPPRVATAVAAEQRR